MIFAVGEYFKSLPCTNLLKIIYEKFQVFYFNPCFCTVATLRCALSVQRCAFRISYNSIFSEKLETREYVVASAKIEGPEGVVEANIKLPEISSIGKKK